MRIEVHDLYFYGGYTTLLIYALKSGGYVRKRHYMFLKSM